MRRAIISSAWSWPMTRSSSVSRQLAARSRSRSCTICPTGMPVQSATTVADRLARRPTAGSAASRPAARASSPAARQLVELSASAQRRAASSASLASTGLCACAALRAASRASRSTSAFSSLPALGQARSSASRSVVQRRSSSRPARSACSTPIARLAVDDAPARSRAPRCARGSPRPRRGVACWLTATRAQAVSSRLTALSGSWRAGM